VAVAGAGAGALLWCAFFYSFLFTNNFYILESFHVGEPRNTTTSTTSTILTRQQAGAQVPDMDYINSDYVTRTPRKPFGGGIAPFGTGAVAAAAGGWYDTCSSLFTSVGCLKSRMRDGG